jgi:hypothetical protein
MLDADKRQLQAELQVDLQEIREKELNYYVRMDWPAAHLTGASNALRLPYRDSTPPPPRCRIG